MSWRGSTSGWDRFFACLPYLLTMTYALRYGEPFLNQLISFGVNPELINILLLPLAPFIAITSIPFAGLIIFFALFLLVIRNDSISHFIRFNTTQAILLSFIVFISGIILMFLSQAFRGGLLIETLDNVLFLGAAVAVVYSIVQSILGRYAEIPTISDAVYMQVR
jgi:hypothetical protein